MLVMDIQKHKHHRGEDKKCSRDWSGLPDNIIATISDKLSLCDSLSFSNVCKPWKSLQKETLTIHRNPLRGFPWLVTSKEGASEAKCCFSILDNKLWKIKMSKGDRGLIRGSFEDWLVMAKPLSDEPDQLYRYRRISLLNPFSGAEVVFPKACTTYSKLVFSGDPGKANCVYMAFSYVTRIFFAWIPEAKDWLKYSLEEGTIDFLMDLISFNGCFYFLTREYNIRVVDAAYAYSTMQCNGYADQINTRFYKVKMSPDIPIKCDSNGQIFRYLVEFRGEILLVIRFMRNLYLETYDFKVFRLDFGQMEWVKVDSLGDFSIFLGRNCTRCYSTKELGVNKGNCIYFTDEFGPMSSIKSDHGLTCSDNDDWGIFRLGGSESFSYIANKDKRPSIWLTAPLSWYFEEFRP